MFQFSTHVELSRSMAAILEMPQYVAYQKNVVYAFIKLSAKSHSFNILCTMDGLSCPTMVSVVEISILVSLCHRPSNCNLSNLCGLYKSLAPEIVSSRNLLRLRRKARCARLSPPADSRAFAESLAPRLAELAFRLRRTLAPSGLALALRARFSSRLRRSFLESIA